MNTYKVINLIIALVVLGLSITTLVMAHSCASEHGTHLDDNAVTDVVHAMVGSSKPTTTKPTTTTTTTTMPTTTTTTTTTMPVKPLKYLHAVYKTAQALTVVSFMMVIVVIVSMFVENQYLNMLSTLICIATLISGLCSVVFGALTHSSRAGIMGIITGAFVLVVVGSFNIKKATMLRK